MATIYVGGKPITRLGKRQFDLLSFLLTYPGWHELPTKHKDFKVVDRLVERRLITVNQTNQMKFEDRRG